MHKYTVPPPHIMRELSYRLDKRQTLDIPDRPPDLHDRHISPNTDRRDPLLDLIRYMRNDLYRPPAIIPLTLPGNNRRINKTRRDTAVPRQVLIDKSLIMPQIQIRLSSVFSYKNFPVLVRAHRPRIHIKVWIELGNLYLKPPGLQDPPK